MNPTGIKLSVVVAAFAGVLFAGAYVYRMWAREMKRRDETPVESVGAIVRDLRRYHARFGRFPENFRELDGTIWPAKPRAIQKTPKGSTTATTSTSTPASPITPSNCWPSQPAQIGLISQCGSSIRLQIPLANGKVRPLP